jgi:polysaccharide export outer membrane protein
MSQNIPVQVGDFIYIPSSTTQQVFVLGEVNHPRSMPYRYTTTLLEAVTSAGGFNETTACKRSVCIVRGSLTKPEIIIVNFNKIVSGKENNIVLDPGDIVYVPSTFITDVSRVSRQIIPFLNVIILGDEAVDVFE